VDLGLITVLGPPRVLLATHGGEDPSILNTHTQNFCVDIGLPLSGDVCTMHARTHGVGAFIY